MANWPGSAPDISGITNATAPNDASVGGPAKITELAEEVTAVGADLYAAKAEGGGFATLTAAFAALWSAISGKASSSHNHDGTYAASGHDHDGTYAASGHDHAGVYDAAGSAAAAQSAAVQRANHTGTQAASTIVDFDTQVRTNRLDQMATPTAAVGMGSQRVTSVGTPTASADAVTKAYADALVGGVTPAAFDALSDFVTIGHRISPPTMTSPPTITVGTSGGASAISSGVTTAPNSAVFRYLGATMENVGTLGSYANCYRQDDATDSTVNTGGQFKMALGRVLFETDANDFEFIIRSENTPENTRFRVWVNGQPAHDNTIVTSTAGQYRRLRVQFSSSVVRSIIVEYTYGSFCGLTIGPTYKVWRSNADTGPKCVALTDSYGLNIDISLSPIPHWIWDNYVVRAGRYFGWDVYPKPIGGTGFLATYSSTQPNYVSRLTTDVINEAPSIVVACGSINEYTDDITTNANDVFANLRSALPSATLIGFSGVGPTNTYTSGMATNGARIQTAVLAQGGTYIDGTDWISGTGSVGAPASNGNADRYHDGSAHLTLAGSTYVSERLASALSTLLNRRAF